MSKLTKDKALEKIQGLADTDEVIIRTQAEEETLLKNFKEAEIERDLKSRVGKIYDDLDNDVFEVTGIRKESREKTYDFIKRVLTDYKGKASDSDVQKLKDELARVKKEGPSGDLLKELENLRNTSASEKKQLLQAIQEAEAKLQHKDVEIALNDGLRDFKFTAGIPKTVLDTYIETAKRDLVSQAKIVDGKVVFTDKDGNTVNDTTTFQPMTAAQMLKQKLSDVIDAGHQGQGAGTGEKKIAKDANGREYPLLVIPPSVNSKIKLSKHLMEQGIASGSKEFEQAYSHYGANLPLA